MLNLLQILGLQGTLILFGVIAFFLILEKWKTSSSSSSSKKAEIFTFVAQATEDVAMAQAETEAEDVAMCSVVSRGGCVYECAVCYCPTTTRCAQCKAVRYCSSKCQIIHWRQGHKNECRPPIASIRLKGFSGNKESVMQSENHDIGTPLGNIDLSSSGFGATSNNGKSEATLPACDDKIFSAIPAKVLVDPEDGNSVQELLKSKSNHTDGDINLRKRSKKMKTNMPEYIEPKEVGSTKLTGCAVAADKLVWHVSKEKNPHLDSVDNFLCDDTKSSRCKQAESSSNEASNACTPTIGGNLVHGPNPSKFDGYNNLPVKIRSVPGLPQDSSKGVKTSVQKFVQQFKFPKESKFNHLSHMDEDVRKYKIVFPYDLFLRLYSCDEVQLRPFGLINCGNSCYANAVLQCLSFTRPLTCYLLQGLHSKACRKRGWCFICEFESLILKARGGNSPLSPIRILSKIHKIGSHLGHGREEDAHEFLRYAVDTMQSICLKEAGMAGRLAEETTLVGLTFGGYLLSKIKCLKCLGKSEHCEQMMDITVEIDGDIGTLEEALAQFTATEILDEDNKYHCSRCKSFEKAKKKLSILEAPNVLTIVLKRFQSGSFEKLNKSVQFPELLNLAPYMCGTTDTSPVYSLYAVVVHLDVSNHTFSGHYMCYVKSSQEEWFRINDSTVVPVELDRVLLEGAYMLLYARNCPRPPASVRNKEISQSDKLRRWNLEAVPSRLSGASKTMSKMMASATTPSVEVKNLRKYPYWMNIDGPTSYQSSSVNGWIRQSMQRISKVKSSSDSSSLFGSSDASSCSTMSTQDATSTEDFSEYIFGEVEPTWYDYKLSSVAGEYDARRRLSWDGQSSAFLHADNCRLNRKSMSS